MEETETRTYQRGRAAEFSDTGGGVVGGVNYLDANLS